jgi:putative transposase
MLPPIKGSRRSHGGESMDDHLLPQRRSPRMPGYDYAQPGAYYITICAHRQAHWFGSVHGGAMRLSAVGQIAYDCWLSIPEHFPTVSLDAFVVMPNHLHGILVLRGGGPALGAVVGTYKAAVTRAARRAGLAPSAPLWHGRYYDHIVRDQADIERIRAYILANPLRWSSRPHRR